MFVASGYKLLNHPIKRQKFFESQSEHGNSNSKNFTETACHPGGKLVAFLNSLLSNGPCDDCGGVMLPVGGVAGGLLLAQLFLFSGKREQVM